MGERSKGLVIVLSLFAMLGTSCRHAEPEYAIFPAGGTQTSAVPLERPVLNSVTLSNRMDPNWLRPPNELFTLGPGDKLEIELLGEPTSKTTTIVAPDGKIYFNLLPGVDAWGLTIAQAKQRLEAELYPKYVKQPQQISLVLRGVESTRISVLGRV